MSNQGVEVKCRSKGVKKGIQTEREDRVWWQSVKKGDQAEREGRLGVLRDGGQTGWEGVEGKRRGGP